MPSVLQHVGSKSSKPSGATIKGGLTVAEGIWNYEFELNDVEALKSEHDAAVRTNHSFKTGRRGPKQAIGPLG